MKKTLAIVLALVMVLSVMAMIPASAADEAVLGWKLCNPAAAGAKIEKVDGSTVKLSGKGYYGNPNNAAMMVSTEKVDISNGFKVSISKADGFITDAADSWIVIGFTDVPVTNDFTSAIQSGACIFILPKEKKARPHTIGGAGYKFENWGSGVAVSKVADKVIGSGSTETVVFEVAKSSGVQNAFFMSNANGSKKVNLLEGQWSESRINAIDKSLATLNGKAYVFVAISASKKAGDSTDANTLATTINVSALKPEAAPVNPTPATGDFTAIYAVVAVIACAVVVGSTVVLKKKED